MEDCCKKQYLVWGETGYLTCANCGAEDTHNDKDLEKAYHIEVCERLKAGFSCPKYPDVIKK